VNVWNWPDPSYGFAATATTLCATSNRGRSWRCNRLPTAARDTTELQFASDRLGWAIVIGHLLTSTNAGATWTRI
jgi:photosystem II stability/assembly factor-like uncharacterized protein